MLGQTISHYRILEKLGEGGMGVVYKAEDLSLDRPVALKFLAPHLLSDDEGRKRFIREAKAAAALDHPNICTVHEIGEAEGRIFIVMAFLEGRPLSERIKEGPLKLHEAVAIAEQIAHGLEAAHEKGVVHRDIKPDNIMLLRGSRGLVKIMDFGLAQLAGSSKLTRGGSTLGTMAYMSPEQAQGADVDRRTDIWSLGVVLYEMVSGQPPFRGDFDQAVIYSIMSEPAEPLTAIRTGVPKELERFVDKCLAKAPEERYQHVEEMLVDLRAIKRRLEEGSPKPASPPREVASRSRGLFLAVAAVAITLALAGIAWFRGGPVVEAPGSQAMTMPFTSYPGDEVGPEFSPDGNQLAFAWQDAGRGNFDIFVKLVGAGEPLQLTRDSADDFSPAWSPDGRHIAFARRSLTEEGLGVFLIPALGGAERRVGQSAADSRGGFVISPLLNRLLAWSPDGRFIAVADRGSKEEPNAVFLLSPETGEKRKLTSPPAQYWGDSDPSFSPDGRNLAFVRIRAVGRSDIYLVPVGRDGSAGGAERRLTFDNRVVYACVWTSDGRSLVFSSNRAGGANLWSIPIEGGEATQLAVGADGAGGISVSRDGRRLAYAHSAETQNIWRTIGPNAGGSQAGRDAPLRLVSSTRLDREPRFSPDGQRIAFHSTRSGRDEIWVSNADGQNPVQLTSQGRASDPRWSPDGRWIAFGSATNENRNICVINAQGGAARRLTGEDSSDDVRPSWSRDGKWIYFGSNRSGQWQVWKAPAGGGTAVQLTRRGGREAFESADGKFVYYAKEWPMEGIWKVPAAGGEETAVLGRGFQGVWALLEDGICFWGGQLRTMRPGVSVPAILFFPFDTGAIRQVTALPEGTILVNGFSVSPDGRWVLYARGESSGSDIMLVENFR